MAATESKAAFAKRKGVNRSTATRWERQGLLSMTPDGLVKIEESEWLLASRPETNRGGMIKTAASSQPRPAPALIADETPEEAAERIVVQEGSAPHTHAEAARIKENYLALLRRLEFDVKSRAVVPIDIVIAGIVEQYGRVRNKMLGIPTRVAPRAAVLRSAEQVRALLEEEVTLALQELTLDGGEDVGLGELRDVIRDRFGTVH